MVAVDALHGPGAVFCGGSGTRMGKGCRSGDAAGRIGVIVAIQAAGFIEDAPAVNIGRGSAVVIGMASAGIAAGVLHKVVGVVAVFRDRRGNPKTDEK